MSEPIDELAMRRKQARSDDEFTLEVRWQEHDGARVVALVDHEFQIINLLNAAQARAVSRLLVEAADICEHGSEPA